MIISEMRNVLLDKLLEQCNSMYQELTCPHGLHDCSDCFKRGFFEGNETYVYNCLKGLCYYVMNYGPAYVSEIYHFLTSSKLLENFYSNRIRVLSLGCGFCPDFIALYDYIYNNQLSPLTLDYLGVDIQKQWLQIIRDILPLSYFNFSFCIGDILKESSFTLRKYDIIFLNKVFSTLKNNNQHNCFLKLLIYKIQNEMSKGAFIIFNDINHYDKGRDEFDNYMSQYLQSLNKFFFPIEDAYNGNGKYIPIQNTQNIYQTPCTLVVRPKSTVTKTVFFVYRKNLE